MIMNSAHKTKKFLGEKMMSKLSRDTDGAIPMVNKKANKPLTEKRRRDRINKCLVQLKNIVMRATGKDEKRFAKLEKADILEMTIGHLIEVHQQNIGKRYADHMNNATPDNDGVYRGMRRNYAMDNLRKCQQEDRLYFQPIPPTPTPYKCGYSGNKAILDVNFDHDDILDRDGILCGSASRVFVFTNDATQQFQTSTPINDRAASRNTIQRLPDEKSFYQGIHTDTENSERVFTSTPLCSSSIKPVRTSTPLRLPSLTKDLLISPEDISVAKRYNINLNTSPELRMQLFASSDESSVDVVQPQSSYSSASGSSGSGGIWRPW